MLSLVSLGALPARADSVCVTAWQQVFNGDSQTFWTFGAGRKGPAPVDPSAQDFAYYGYQPPFAVEDYAIGNLNTFYATYGLFADPAATNTFAGYATLTDQNGFVAGLPFECIDPFFLFPKEAARAPRNCFSRKGWKQVENRRNTSEANESMVDESFEGKMEVLRTLCFDRKANGNPDQIICTQSRKTGNHREELQELAFCYLCRGAECLQWLR
jgi:hypothetical protein